MPDHERDRSMLAPASGVPQRPPAHESTLPVLRLDVEAALSWLQFPQQDADDVEEKPKVHLEIEAQEGGRQRSGGGPGGMGRGSLWELKIPHP